MNEQATPVLEVDQLRVDYAGIISAVRGISFSIAPGECFALVGESGCGKSSIARAVMGLLPEAATVQGSVRIAGQQIIGTDERELRAIRGIVAGFVGQDPYESCNPLSTIHAHVGEAWRAHGLRPDSRIIADQLARLGIADANEAMWRYPHQWSGGMLQRANIAAASAHGPALIVADEPTSALDADHADTTLEVLKANGAAVLLVSHDMRLVERHADTVAVCYAGRIVELGAVETVSSSPRHPYTVGLIRSLPRQKGHLPETMPGGPPSMTAPDRGCAFAPRCPQARDLCHHLMPELENGVRCHTGDACGPSRSGSLQPFASRGTGPHGPQGGPEVIRLRAVRKSYGRRRQMVQAVAGADLRVQAGEIVGISGPSGCGKSTLLRLIAGLEAPDSGEALLAGGRNRKELGPGFVMPIFQDPLGSLDLRWPIWKSISEPATAPGLPKRSKADLRRLAADKLAAVGLAHLDLEARPTELSGGQCQRVSIARALAAEPALLVADEPTSALDASVSASILHLLADLAHRGTAIVIVSHDRPLLDALCDRVLRMENGALIQPDLPIPQMRCADSTRPESSGEHEKTPKALSLA